MNTYDYIYKFIAYKQNIEILLFEEKICKCY